MKLIKFIRSAWRSTLLGRLGRRRLLAIGLIILLLLTSLVYLTLLSPKFAEAAWFDDQWGYRKKLTIDNTKVSGSTNLTNFPMLVSATDTDWKDISNGGQVGKSDGTDILFTDVNGVKLDHEIESYTASSGALQAWVRIPTLLASEDMVIFIYYGNPSAADQQNVTAVWTDYAAVYHLDDDFNDSTSNARNATNSGSVDIAGRIADGQDFEFADTTDRIELGTWSVSGSTITVQAWVNFESFDQTDGRIVSKASGTATQNHVFMLGSILDGGSQKLRARIKTGTDDAAGTTTLKATSGTTSTATWYLAAATYDGSNMRLFLDGTDVGSVAKTGSLRENAFDVWAGNNPTAAGNPLDGILDEARVATVARNADWLTTEYNNQNSPSTFYSTSSEEKGPGPNAWWKFDEGVDNTCSGGTNDACDATSNANDAAMTGGTWQTSDMCVSGHCMFFDGTDDVATITNASAIDLDAELAGAFTFQAWVRINSDGEGNVGEIFDKGANTYLRITNEGTDGLADLEASLDLTTADATLNITDALTTDTWYHVAITWSDDADDEITVYVDGISQGSSTDGSGAAAADANDLLIGGSSTANFDGQIDDFRVYPYELSATQIRKIMNESAQRFGPSTGSP